MDVVVQAHRDILQRVGIFRLTMLYTLKLKRQARQHGCFHGGLKYFKPCYTLYTDVKTCMS